MISKHTNKSHSLALPTAQCCVTIKKKTPNLVSSQAPLPPSLQRPRPHTRGCMMMGTPPAGARSMPSSKWFGDVVITRGAEERERGICNNRSHPPSHTSRTGKAGGIEEGDVSSFQYTLLLIFKWFFSRHNTLYQPQRAHWALIRITPKFRPTYLISGCRVYLFPGDEVLFLRVPHVKITAGYKLISSPIFSTELSLVTFASAVGKAVA